MGLTRMAMGLTRTAMGLTRIVLFISKSLILSTEKFSVVKSMILFIIKLFNYIRVISLTAFEFINCCPLQKQKRKCNDMVE
jgi:hypothetical protein